MISILLSGACSQSINKNKNKPSFPHDFHNNEIIQKIGYFAEINGFKRRFFLNQFPRLFLFRFLIVRAKRSNLQLCDYGFL